MSRWRIAITQDRQLSKCGRVYRMFKGTYVEIDSGYSNPIYNDTEAVIFAFKCKNVDLVELDYFAAPVPFISVLRYR